jgi:hypothetical protein
LARFGWAANPNLCPLYLLDTGTSGSVPGAAPQRGLSRIVSPVPTGRNGLAGLGLPRLAAL